MEFDDLGEPEQSGVVVGSQLIGVFDVFGHALASCRRGCRISIHRHTAQNDRCDCIGVMRPSACISAMLCIHLLICQYLVDFTDVCGSLIVIDGAGIHISPAG